MDLEGLFQNCVESPNDVVAVKVLADAIEESDWPETASWVRSNGLVGDGVDDGGDGVDDGGDGVGDGVGGGGGDGGGGDGGDGGGGDGDGFIIYEGYIVKDGFKILSIKGGYYPYVLVGWVERRDFWITIRNSRVIRRFGCGGQLAQLAKYGPIKGSNPTQLLDLSELEDIPASSISRAIAADPSKWPECPKPSDED